MPESDYMAEVEYGKFKNACFVRWAWQPNECH
jgi:hypothetical protein